MFRCQFLCMCPYRRACDRERKQVDCAKQLVVRRVGNSSSPTLLDTTMSIKIHREVPRWRKCSTKANNLSNEFCSAAHELNYKEIKLVLRRFFDKVHVKCLLQKLVRDARDVEHKLSILNSLKATYVQLVAHKSKDNMPYRNALLKVVASNQVGPS